MSDRRRAQCWGKQRHASRKAAEEVRATMAERRARPALLWLLNAYCCPHCHSWHLGRSKAARKRYIEAVQSGEAAWWNQPHREASDG